MSRILCSHGYDHIISTENLLEAWNEFKNGKRKRKDVQEFERDLMKNILSLHDDLTEKTYEHSSYEAFNISDPKPRNIHKASVRDRLMHHAIYRQLYPFFDRMFIPDSYSCRLEKGTHRAIMRFIQFGRKVSRNNTRTSWVLKCDVRKFFASIDQSVLLGILERYVPDKDILWLLNQVISSFDSKISTKISDPQSLAIASNCGYEGKRGLPLGNLTSQLLVNIYMNEFDQYVKHRLKEKYYIRYADDFVILSLERAHLEELISKIKGFLSERLKLSLHPDKVFIKTLASGIDFLGWVNFPHHRVLRTATKRKMMRRLGDNAKGSSRASYLGMLSHGNGYNLQEKVRWKT